MLNLPLPPTAPVVPKRSKPALLPPTTLSKLIYGRSLFFQLEKRWSRPSTQNRWETIVCGRRELLESGKVFIPR